MKPYYQDDAVTIYHGDCREILPKLGPVDLVLTDPPYGVGENYLSFVDDKESLLELISESFPLARVKAPLTVLTPGVENLWFYPQPTWSLAWISTAGCGSGPWGFCCWQPILVYGPDPYLASGKGRQRDIIESNEASIDYGHPCSKPIGVWRKIIVLARL